MKTLIAITLLTIAQMTLGNQPPAVNEKCPDFTLKDIHNWKQKTATLKDYKGKWLVISAWSLGCGSCIDHFPVINEVYKELKTQVEFILLGQEHPNIRNWFARFEKKYALQLPYGFDSSFFTTFQIYTVPREIIIDPQGIIRVISAERITAEKIKQLIAGNNLFTKRIEDPIPFDYTKPYGVNDNGGRDEDFLFRSVLAKWTYGQDMIQPDFNKIMNWSNFTKNGFQFVGASVPMLYQMAYIGRNGFPFDSYEYGKEWFTPVFEIKDTSILTTDMYRSKNGYIYSLIVPDSLATDDNLQTIMRRDLKSYFGFDVSIEKRDMPVWEVKATKDLHYLQTNGGPEQHFDNYMYNTEFAMRNVAFKELLQKIATFNYLDPVLDQTGMDVYIDMSLKSLPTDFESLRKELADYGILFVKSTRKMKVVVVRDPKPLSEPAPE